MNPDTLIWDVGNLTSVLIAKLNACPYTCLLIPFSHKHVEVLSYNTDKVRSLTLGSWHSGQGWCEREQELLCHDYNGEYSDSKVQFSETDRRAAVVPRQMLPSFLRKCHVAISRKKRRWSYELWRKAKGM